jgi:hypothetical protein
MLEEMESGTCPISPGPTCYDGFILACARCRAWEDILAAYETMQLLHVPVSSACSHGVLLAAAKLGQQNEVKKYVKTFLTSKAQLRGDGAMLALRILLNGIITIDRNDNDTNSELSMDEIRERLRLLGQENHVLHDPCLQLIRSLRIAVSEESRPLNESNHERNRNANNSSISTSAKSSSVRVTPLAELLDRRHVAWHTMLTDLVFLVDAVECKSKEIDL